jgi:dTDP-4-amino-4,6-dideoxygalactose transaminase
MTATPSAILFYNAIPVFADIQKDIFTLDPQAVERGITKNTKAILAVHIFGHPCDLTSLVKIAKKHNLKLIEDCAQAPAATWDGKYVGQFGDIGVFSLNYHKHINSGEGGVCVTSAKDLAERLQLIRNHAEAVAEDKGVSNYTNLLGWNYRMTEVEAAIGNEQLKKLDSFVQKRIGVARQLDQLLKGIKGITLPEKYPNAKHVYYMYALKINRDSLGITRQQFLSALEAEGVNFYCGYTKPLYLQPMYQKKIVYGNKGCPFICQFYKGKTNYEKGICPVAEKMFFEELANFPLCLYDLDKNDVKNIANAIYKVVENKNELKNYA